MNIVLWLGSSTIVALLAYRLGWVFGHKRGGDYEFALWLRVCSKHPEAIVTAQAERKLRYEADFHEPLPVKEAKQ